MGANIGYPVILKAKAGGGGRGMRIVRTPEELPGSVSRRRQLKRPTPSAMATLYMEKFIEQPRHIEFQVLADEHGDVTTSASASAPSSAATRSSSKKRLAPGHSQAARRDSARLFAAV